MLISHFDKESHRAGRIGWLRAAVLGANDGTISVASLVVGVAAAGAPQGSILLTGVAGLVAGAMSCRHLQPVFPKLLQQPRSLRWLFLGELRHTQAAHLL
jgi:hypothetical protein